SVEIRLDTSHALFCLSLPFQRYGHVRDLHSFPTRRSSDLSSNRPCSPLSSRACRCSVRRPGLSDLGSRRRPSRVGKASSTALERSEEHTSELQSRENLVCRLLLEKKKNETHGTHHTPSTQR